MISELDERFLRPSQDQLDRVAPKIISQESIIAELRAKIIELEAEIKRLQNELMNLIQKQK